MQLIDCLLVMIGKKEEGGWICKNWIKQRDGLLWGYCNKPFPSAQLLRAHFQRRNVDESTEVVFHRVTNNIDREDDSSDGTDSNDDAIGNSYSSIVFT